MSPLVNITGGFPGGARGEEPAWRCRGHKRHLIRGYGISPGEGNGNPLQYSCPENPMDGEPGGLQSMRSQGQVWLSTQAHTHRTRERKASQSRSVSCDQKQPRRKCQSSQEVGTGSLRSSCCPLRALSRPASALLSTMFSLLCHGSQSRFPSLESCRGVSLTSHWEVGTRSPLKEFQPQSAEEPHFCTRWLLPRQHPVLKDTKTVRQLALVSGSSSQPN